MFKLHKNWKWRSGRQSRNDKVPYQVIQLLECSFPPFDIYLIKYPEGARIEPHKDRLGKEKRHYRMNLILKQPEKGGLFICNGAWINFPRFKFFRPDLYTHSVSRIEKGERLVLSFGWARKQKQTSQETI